MKKPRYTVPILTALLACMSFAGQQSNEPNPRGLSELERTLSRTAWIEFNSDLTMSKRLLDEGKGLAALESLRKWEPFADLHSPLTLRLALCYIAIADYPVARIHMESYYWAMMNHAGIDRGSVHVRVLYALTLYLNGESNTAWQICNWSNEQIDTREDNQQVRSWGLSMKREHLGTDLATAYSRYYNSSRALVRTIFDAVLEREEDAQYTRLQYGRYLFDSEGVDLLPLAAEGPNASIATEAKARIAETVDWYRKRGITIGD